RRHEEIRYDAVCAAADLARAEDGDGPYAPVPADGDRHLDHRRCVDRCLFGVTPVLAVRLHGDGFLVRRLRATGLLARPDAAGAGRADLPQVARPDLLYVRPVVVDGRRARPSLPGRPRAAPRVARH